MSHRVASLNKEFKKALSKILDRIEFPDAKLVTLTRVELSSDLSQAKAFVSVLPVKKREAVLDQIKEKKSPLKKDLAQQVKIKKFPQLHFKIERKTQRADKINRLLKDVDT